MKISAAIAAMAMPLVLEKDRPRMPAAMSAAVMLAANQVTLVFWRTVLLSPASSLAAFDWAM